MTIKNKSGRRIFEFVKNYKQKGARKNILNKTLKDLQMKTGSSFF